MGVWLGPAALHPGVGGATGTEQLDASTLELSAPCLDPGYCFTVLSSSGIHNNDVINVRQEISR